MSEISHQSVAPTQAEEHRAGDVIARHRHDDHQLIYISAGVLSTHTARGAWAASPNSAVWVPAGLWHEHRLYGRSALHVVGFPVSETPLSIDSPAVVAVTPLLRELLIEYTRSPLDTDDGQLLRTLIVHRLRVAPVQALTIPEARDERLARACQWASDDLAQPKSLSQLAMLTGASQRTLSRLFRDEFGMTYPQWRTNVRLFRAMIDLAEGASVTETAHLNGWPTPSAFVSTFANAMGCTPGQYRAAAASGLSDAG